jgi:hypothetical protein
MEKIDRKKFKLNYKRAKNMLLKNDVYIQCSE